MFRLTILGTNAALPTSETITSAQIIHNAKHAYLIDCGEGTQMKMQKWHIKRNKISAIFISHLHGDHLYGLPGLLTSYAHFQRSEKLSIIGPPGIKSYVETTLHLSQAYIGFELEIIEVNSNDCVQVYEDQNITVEAFPLQHRIITFGYIFREKVKINLKAEIASNQQLSFDHIRLLKSGKDIVVDGVEYKASECVYIKNHPKSYAYCSDTIFDPTIIPYILGVDAIYHEATYVSNMHTQAKERMHSTAEEAALIASMAKAGLLILGHFSTRYNNLQPFLEEASQHFVPVLLAKEGLEIEIGNKI